MRAFNTAMAIKQKNKDDYGESSIRVLKGLEPVKQRPGMYTLTDNPLHIIQEVIDNASDEVLAGFGTKISVSVNEAGIITVEDDELVVAFLDMVENHKMIVENSGLLTVAALKHLDVSDKRVVSILSGGNMDVITMSSVVQQGLIFRDRIFTVSVLLPDKPGELSKVSAAIAAEQGNVIKLEHNQFVTTNRSAAVELRITLESFGTEHKKQIMKALEKKGYKPKLVRTSL